MFACCPACQTVFRIRPEQLRMHHGEVRCGRCYATFNALDHLFDASPAADATSNDTRPVAATPHGAPSAGPTDDSADRFFILEDKAPAEDDDGDYERDRKENDEMSNDDVAFAVFDTEPHPVSTRDDENDNAPRDTHERAPDETFVDPLDFVLPEDFPSRRAAVSAEQHADPYDVKYAGPARAPFPEFTDRASPYAEYAEPSAQDAGFDEGDVPATAASAPRDPHEAAAFDASGPDTRRTLDSADDTDPWAPFAAGRTESAGTAGEPIESRDAMADDSVPEHIGAHRSTSPDHAFAFEDASEAERLDATYGRPPSPGRRWLFGLGIGVLLGTLAVQGAYIFRGEITREWPQLRPLYLSACAYFHCSIPLPRLAGSISIEASELQSEPGEPGRFLLNATIRNRASYPMAYPHLELTLTDAKDRPLVRRALAPSEWVPAELRDNGGLEHGFDAGRDVPVKIPFEAPGIDATGYRIYVFYP